MAISTYDELVTAVGAWLERSDLSTRASDFVALAEAQMNRTLRVRPMETRSATVVGTDDEFISIPADFLEEQAVVISDGVDAWVLDPQPHSVLEMEPPTTGRPTHYALIGDAIQLYPKPEKNYTATLVYFARIPALGPDQQTNWLLTKAPDAYLYGALSHAAPFLEDDTGNAGVFASYYGGAITALKAEHVNKVGRLTTDHPSRERRFNILRGDI